MGTTNRKKLWAGITAFTFILIIAIAGCKKKSEDEPTPTPTPDPLKTTYTLKTKDVLGVSGTVTFAEASSGSANSIVTISLTGPISGSAHPAHIHANSAIEGGSVVYPLNDVDPTTGKSTTTLTVAYNTLTNFDGYVNVHESASNLTTLLAQGDIGGNVLTGTSKTYVLDTIGTFGVSGTAKLEKRKNNNTLVTISVSPIPLPSAGSPYGAGLHVGEYHNSPGPITVNLNIVDAVTGKSYTNVKTYSNGNPITYTNLIGYTGYFEVDDMSGTAICQGKITP